MSTVTLETSISHTISPDTLPYMNHAYVAINHDPSRRFSQPAQRGTKSVGGMRGQGGASGAGPPALTLGLSPWPSSCARVCVLACFRAAQLLPRSHAAPRARAPDATAAGTAWTGDTAWATGLAPPPRADVALTSGSLMTGGARILWRAAIRQQGGLARQAAVRARVRADARCCARAAFRRRSQSPHKRRRYSTSPRRGEGHRGRSPGGRRGDPPPREPA